MDGCENLGARIDEAAAADENDFSEEGSWYSDLERPEEFYSDAAKYWESIPSTVNGMLGGFGDLSPLDAASSKKFILPLLQGASAMIQAGRALDCGAGIGRVSKRLLLPLFSEVDLVEQNPAFLEKAKTFLGPMSCRVGNYFAVGLQDFHPEEGRYDVIWIQWVMGHLTDDDLITFFQRCRKGLSPAGGLIVIKENISSEEDVFDSNDSSVTRSLSSILKLTKKAGLVVVKEEDQENFPDSIFTVKIVCTVDFEKSLGYGLETTSTTLGGGHCTEEESFIKWRKNKTGLALKPD